MIVILLALLACGTECDRGDMLASEEGIVVTEAEHPDGWGRGDCAGCHALDTVHRTSCTSGIDMDALRAQVADVGYDGCPACHGANGVPGLADAGDTADTAQGGDTADTGEAR